MILYHKDHHTIIFLKYVDDILVIWSNDVLIQTIVTNLNFVFVLKNLGTMSYFLDIKGKYWHDYYHLYQTKYIVQLVEKV